MNGAPIPPVPDAPEFPLALFLGVLLAFAIVFALAWYLGVEQEIRRAREHEDRAQVFREAVERERENVQQMLIDASPGGRKPWQNERGDS